MAEAREWAREALLSGRMRIEDEAKLADRTQEMKTAGSCASDGPHVVALGQIDGARLLCSNDKEIKKDFKNKSLNDNPHGKICATPGSGTFTKSHRRLLLNRSLCRA